MESNCISSLSLSLFLSSLYFFSPSFSLLTLPSLFVFLSCLSLPATVSSSVYLGLPRELPVFRSIASRQYIFQVLMATAHARSHPYCEKHSSLLSLLHFLSLSLFLSSSCFLSLSSSVPRSSTAHTVHKKTPLVRKSGILFHSYNRYCHRREDLTSLTLHARAWKYCGYKIFTSRTWMRKRRGLVRRHDE